MITEDLIEAWRLAARYACDNHPEIKALRSQPWVPRIGTRTPRNPIASISKESVEIADNRFSRKISYLMNTFNLNDEDILKANVEPDSDSQFIQSLYDHMRTEQSVMRQVMAKSLLIGLKTVQKSRVP